MINVPIPSVTGRTYTLADPGINSNFVITEGAQTINGAKTFSSPVTISATSSQLVFATTTAAVFATLDIQSTANRLYGIADPGANAFVVMDQGAQVINGAKTFTSVVTATAAGVNMGNYQNRFNNDVQTVTASTNLVVTFNGATSGAGVTYSGGTFTLPLPGTYAVSCGIRLASTINATFDVWWASSEDSFFHGLNQFPVQTLYGTSSSIIRTTVAGSLLKVTVFTTSAVAVIAGSSSTYMPCSVTLIQATL